MRLKSFLVLMFCAFLISPAAFAAEGKKKKKSKYGKHYMLKTKEEVYRKFKYVSPKGALEHLREAREYVKKVGLKKARKAFSKYPSRWYVGLQDFQTTIINCDTFTLEAMSFPGLKKFVNKKGLLKKVKDRKGRPYLPFCGKAHTSPNGYFYLWTQTFQGVKDVFPYYMVAMPLEVDGVKYIFTTNYPNLDYTQDELNQKVKNGEI